MLGCHSFILILTTSVYEESIGNSHAWFDHTPILDGTQMMLEKRKSRAISCMQIVKTQKVPVVLLDFYNFCRNNGIY
jgi:hypothetical protein